jgi:hypothetical protein
VKKIFLILDDYDLKKTVMVVVAVEEEEVVVLDI